MKLRLRGALVAIFVFCFSVFSFSTPVFADPVTTPETTAPTTPTTEDNTTTPADGEANADGEEDGVIPIEDQPTCADQIGGLAWLVCPGTGFLANVVDGAYDLLTRLIEVEPVTSDTESPFYLIWGTCRKLTNIVFIIMMLICILSQITGIGISNYGIKRTLPKLLAVAILANLSFMLCRIGIDLSNILGDGIRSIFEFVEQESFANGALSADFQFFNSWENIVTTFLGVGTGVVASAAVLANVGGFTGLLWLILPVLLGAVVSIVSAVLIMAGRQALIYILLMISPIAIVAYAMPNLSKWTSKWYQLFMRMLFFYPMFSALYGASRLAGLVVMCSAKDAVGVVLGLAIQVIPLFMSIPLMKMSGTFLNKIDGIVHGISAPAMRSFGHMADQKRAQAYQRQRFSNSPMLHTRLARYLQQRETDRVMDTRALEAINRDTYERRSKQGYFNRNGQLNRRGVMMNEINAMQIKNEAIRLKIDNDFDEGFKTDMELNQATGRYEFKDHRVNRRNAQSIARANATIPISLRERAIEKARSSDIHLQNTKNLANSLNDVNNSQIRQLVEGAFNLQPDDTAGYERAKSVVLATAIAERRKFDSESSKRHADRFAETRAGRGIIDEVEKTLGRQGEGDSVRNLTAAELASYKANAANIDYTVFDAALPEIAKRGDHGDILEIFRKYSGNITDSGDLTNPQDLALMTAQKHISDNLLGLKSDNMLVAHWAKALNIRRAMYGQGKAIEGYISFEDFLQDKQLEGDSDECFKKVSRKAFVADESNKSLFKTQDRTVYKQLLDYKEQGIIKNNEFIYDPKDIRGSIASGEMEGERLNNALRFITNGFRMGEISDGADVTSIQALANRQSDYFKTEENKQAAYEFVKKIVGGMSAKQLSSSKSTAILTFSRLLAAIDGRVHDVTYRDDSGNLQHEAVSTTLIEMLEKNNAITELKSSSNSSMRSGMNPTVAKLVGVLNPDT